MASEVVYIVESLYKNCNEVIELVYWHFRRFCEIYRSAIGWASPIHIQNTSLLASYRFVVVFNPIRPGGGGAVPAPVSTFKNFLDV